MKPSKIMLPFVLILLLLFALNAFADVPRTMYVYNNGGETLSKLNLENGAIIQDFLPIGQTPNQIAIHNNLIYVVNSGTDDIMVIDPRNDNQILKTIALPEGSNPWSIAFPGAYKAYVSNWNANTVSVIDLETGQIIKDIEVGVAPEGILVSGYRAFVANSGYSGWGVPYATGTVSIIDTNLDSVIQTLEVPTNVQDFALDPMGRIHAICTGDYMNSFGKVAVIDLYTGAYWNIPGVIDTIDINGSPGDIAITAQGKGYCVAWGDGTNGFLYSYDATTYTTLRDASDPILVGPNVSRIAYDAKENVLWIPTMVDYAGDGSVQKFDVQKDSVVWQSGVLGSGTYDLAILEPLCTSDPWADEVVNFTPGINAGYGENYFPFNVLGPPNPDPAINEYFGSSGSNEILTLGIGGEIILKFTNNVILNEDGVDLIIFENPFIYMGQVFMEPAYVAVSQDGETWMEFPSDTTDMSGLAGVNPVKSTQDPTDPEISGADQFDLDVLGLDWARFVKITDMNIQDPDGYDNGFDLDAVVAVNSGTTTSVTVHENNAVPVTIELAQNYPNPFNPETQIVFSVAKAQHVSLTVYNQLGQTVKKIIDTRMQAGNHIATWDGTNISGDVVSSGIYIYQLRTTNSVMTRRMTLLK